MSEISWINGVEAGLVSIDNRGLAYGDGLFETIAVRAGRCQLLDLHLQRLFLGCQKLAINLDRKKLQAELLAFTALCRDFFPADAVIKVTICRQAGGRGYAGDSNVAPLRILSGFALAPLSSDLQRGVELRFCTTPISVNPALAGMKHLCRLDNVLARSEWGNDGSSGGADFFDGLMLDDRQHVIEGTMSNLFLIKGNALVTPNLERSGVAGVMREWIMAVLASKLGLSVREAELSKAELFNADELFVCNSVHMLVPVKSLACHSWQDWPKTAELQRLAEELILA